MEPQETKLPQQSKTVIVNLVGSVAAAYTLFSGAQVPQEYLTLAIFGLSVINVGLRFITSHPIKLPFIKK